MSKQGTQSNPWKWVAIAALVVLIGGPCVCFGGMTLLGGAAITGIAGEVEPMFKSNLNIATNEELLELLGQPYEMKDGFQGELDPGKDGADGVADFTYDLVGQKTTGRVIVKATRPSGGDWIYETMVLEIEKDGAPATYDLIDESWR